MLYNQMEQNDKAEIQLREVVTAQPELYEVQYSLGLLLAEEKQYVEAARYLEAGGCVACLIAPESTTTWVCYSIISKETCRLNLPYSVPLNWNRPTWNI